MNEKMTGLCYQVVPCLSKLMWEVFELRVQQGVVIRREWIAAWKTKERAEKDAMEKATEAAL